MSIEDRFFGWFDRHKRISKLVLYTFILALVLAAIGLLIILLEVVP